MILNVLIAVALLSAPAKADEALAIARIGVLSPAVSTLEEGLRQGLRQFGYIEGKNLVIEWRRSTGADEEFRRLATELVRAKVDLIVASGSTAAGAALAATTLPVVFAPVGDPVASGFVASLAKPGGNGTGVSIVSTELIAKRLEFLRLVAPRARRIIYLMNSSNPLAALQLEEAHKAARTLAVELVPVDVHSAAEIDRALRTIRPSTADGVLVSGEFLFLENKATIVRSVRRLRLPAMFPLKQYHDDGALMSYGTNLNEVMRHAAVYVDKILKGAKPSELPVEQVSKYELIIDLRVARAMGIQVPQDLLLRADEVIR